MYEVSMSKHFSISALLVLLFFAIASTCQAMEEMHDGEGNTQNCAANKETDKESESWWQSIRRGLSSGKKTLYSLLLLLLFVNPINGEDGLIQFYDGRHTYQWSQADGGYLPTDLHRPYVLRYGNETCFYDYEKKIFIFNENFNQELFIKIFEKKIHASECAHLCKATSKVFLGRFQVVRCKKDSHKLQKMRSYLGGSGVTYVRTEMKDSITLMYPENLYGKGPMVEPYYAKLSDLNTLSVLNTVEEEVEKVSKSQKRKKKAKPKHKKRKRRT